MGERLRAGRYEVLGTLGEGAQAVTLEARDAERGGRAVAIKRFDVRGASRWKDVELAEREARVLASLDHPLLPRYIEHFEEGGALYLVMEKIDGESVAALRKRGVAFDERDAWRFLRDASEALDYLHARSPPLIHRDVKPTNVIRRDDGSFALVDFGAVRDKLRLEGGSTVVGTFGYMAPEQFQGRALPASDVYAAGATALAMLTGVEPESLPHRGLRIDVRAAAGRGWSKRLVAALEAMTDPDPDRRAARIAPLLPSPSEGDRAHEGRGRDANRGRVSRKERRRAQRAEMDARRAQKAARRVERAEARAHRRARSRLAGPWRWLVPLMWALWGISWVTRPSVLVMVPALIAILALRRFATVHADDAGGRSEGGEAGAAGTARAAGDRPSRARVAADSARVRITEDHAGDGEERDAGENDDGRKERRRRNSL